MINIKNWLQSHQYSLQFVASLSLALLILTLVAFIWIVISLPQDYFIRTSRESVIRSRRCPLLWQFITACKNLFGLLLILLGIALLVLPGQGAFTILIGLTMMNFPGKYRLEQKLVSQPAIHKTLNAIRRLAKRPPLEVPSLDKSHTGKNPTSN